MLHQAGRVVRMHEPDLEWGNHFHTPYSSVRQAPASMFAKMAAVSRGNIGGFCTTAVPAVMHFAAPNMLRANLLNNS